MSAQRREDVEEAFVRAFVVESKRDRALTFLASKKNRNKILSSLPHFRDFDARFIHKIDSACQTPQGIYEGLKARRAPDCCYVVSVDPGLDGTVRALREVLEEVVGWKSGTIFACIPGHLAYYEGEGQGERYFLER